MIVERFGSATEFPDERRRSANGASATLREWHDLIAPSALLLLSLHPTWGEYLQRIDATLEPFAGRFLIHGGEREVLEGTWPGHLIVIEFPDRARARAWFQSTAYRQILPLRTNSSEGDAVLVDGFAEGHRATVVLSG
jgi:uncharacterized protein (DUF1330 family)